MKPVIPTTFDDRERGFEAKYAHDEELRFLALARRDKLFALWAVGRLHLSRGAREKLIHDVVAVQGFPNHDAALLQSVAGALVAAGADPGEAPAALERLGNEAREQILRGGAAPVDLSAPPVG